MGTAAHAHVIEGPRVRLVAVAAEHAAPLRAIMAEPEVHRWWGEPDPDFPFDADDVTAVYAVTLAGQVVGLVQYAEETDPMYRHAGIDVALSSRVHGRGLGREVVAVVAAHLIDERGHHRLTIDPSAGNERAIRCYTAVGFRPVGVLRRYERGPDGAWRDGLLMDLLAGELVRATRR